MKALHRTRNDKTHPVSVKKSKNTRTSLPTKPGLDPQFVAAAKASKKKFAPLFKRLAKT